MISSKINNNYRIQIPSKIRRKLKIKRTDIVEWKINEKGKVELNFKNNSKIKDNYKIIPNLNSFNNM